MDRRPVLVGQAPSRTGDPMRPCTGAFGMRLACAAGHDGHANMLGFLAGFQRMNVLDRYPGRDVKGDLFPMSNAMAAADLKRVVLRGRTVVLAGRGVARAFRLPVGDYMTWTTTLDGMRVAVIPHPSGINAWWNDPDQVKRLGRFLKLVTREST